MSYNVKTLQPNDEFSQRIQLSGLGPRALVNINDDAILCDDPDQLDALGEACLAAARDLRASLVDHGFGQVRDDRSVA